MVKISKFEEWLYWNHKGLMIPLMIFVFMVIEGFLWWLIPESNDFLKLILSSCVISGIIVPPVAFGFLELVNEQVQIKKDINSGRFEKEKKEKLEEVEAAHKRAIEVDKEKASILHLEQVRKLEIERLRVEIANAKSKNRHTGRRQIRG